MTQVPLLKYEAAIKSTQKKISEKEQTVQVARDFSKKHRKNLKTLSTNFFPIFKLNLKVSMHF